MDWVGTHQGMGSRCGIAVVPSPPDWVGLGGVRGGESLGRAPQGGSERERLKRAQSEAGCWRDEGDDGTTA